MWRPEDDTMSFELKLQVVVFFPTRFLGAELESSQRAVCTQAQSNLSALRRNFKHALFVAKVHLSDLLFSHNSYLKFG